MAIRLLSVLSNSNPAVARQIVTQLSGVAVECAAGVVEGRVRLQGSDFDAALVFLPQEEWSGREVLEEIQRVNPLIPILILDADATLAGAVELAKLGAYQVFGAEACAARIEESLVAAASSHRERRASLHGIAPAQEPWRKFLVGRSRAMQNVMQVVRLIGSRRSTVLITGETGTGKEIVARAIHMASPRANQPMVAVNCSALPENLLEAELFGHVKGAFTGAVTSRVGRFEQADRSTIFLDEIGDLPLDLQAKLLRVLQEREFQRLGSSETIAVDVRVLAATNVDLVQRIREGKFREDLYYRLNVVPLTLPPLRDRNGDIPALVYHFIEKICRQEDLPPREIATESFERLGEHYWPGNVRELENAVEMAIALSGDRLTLYPSDFPLPSIRLSKPAPANSAPMIAVPDDGLDYERTVGHIERAILEQAMQKSGGNKKQAAEMLGLKRTTFAAKLKSLSAAVSGAETGAEIYSTN